MAAGSSDLFKKLSRKWVGQIGAAGVANASVQTIPLASTTNLPTDTAVVAVIDRVDSNGTKTPSLEETVIGVVSGSNITNATRGAEGTAQAHSAGAVVEILVTAKGWNDIVDGLLVEHLQTGRHGDVCATSLTLTASGTIQLGSSAASLIRDTNANELLKFTQTASAVNEFTVANAATGGGPTLSATGGDTNIAFIVSPKGSGDVDIKPSGAATTVNIQVNSADPTRGIYIPAAGMFSATTNGAATGQIETTTNKINCKVFDFDQSTEEYAWFCIPAPSYWDLGTVTAEFHWTAASGSGDVIWGIAGLARSNDDALDTALGTAVTVTDTLITANDEHLTSDTSAMTIGGTPAKDDFLYFRVYRDADAGGDTLNADARLMGVTVRLKRGQYEDS